MKTFLTAALSLTLALVATVSLFSPTITNAEGYVEGATMGSELSNDTPAETKDADEDNANDAQEQANGDDGVGEQILDRILGGVIAPFTGLSYIFLAVANGLLFVAGSLLNWVFIGTVLEFSQNFGNSAGLLIAWGIMRDLGNIFLLFGFVFIGISTILGLQTYAAKKTLPRLIIFAVLLNFSLFVAEVVIDVTNAVSTVLYNQAGIAELCQYNLESATELQSVTTLENCSENIGISGVIFNASGLAGLEPPEFWTSQHQSGWWDLVGLARDAWDNISVTHQLHVIQVMIGLTLFSFVAMVVFIAASIMLLIRAVVLTLLMVTAPIGFAGTVVPFLGKISKDWWDNLIKQSFFAPAFILLVLVGLKIIESTGLNDGNNIVGALSSGDVSSMQVISLFALVIGFMVAALIVAKKFGAYGADFAISTAANATFGPLGFLSRRLIGAPAATAVNAIRRTGWATTPQGRLLTGILEHGAAARSLDIRSTPLGAISKAAGVDLGGPKGPAAGGIRAIDKALRERRVEELETISEARGERFARLQTRRNSLLDRAQSVEASDPGKAERLRNRAANLDRRMTRVMPDRASFERAEAAERAGRETLEPQRAAAQQRQVDAQAAAAAAQTAEQAARAAGNSAEATRQANEAARQLAIASSAKRDENQLADQLKALTQAVDRARENMSELDYGRHARNVMEQAEFFRMIPGTRTSPAVDAVTKLDKIRKYETQDKALRKADQMLDLLKAIARK